MLRASALACAAMVFVHPGARADEPGARARWVVVSVARDTGCAVLDDGAGRRLHCAGDYITGDHTRLLRIEGSAVVFEVHGGAAALLRTRLAVGEALDPEALRRRMAEATGPRPGWVEFEPLGEDGQPRDRSP